MSDISLEPPPAAQTALLIIDLQVALLADPPVPRDIDVVVDRINALAARARRQRCPVIVIQHEEPHPALAHESAGWQLDPRLKTEPGDLRLRKRTVDSFLETPLDAWLKVRYVKRVVICGFASEFCVDTTTRRAAALGFDVVVVSDAHTTQDRPEIRAEAIRDLHTFTLTSITTFRGSIVAKRADELFS
jgi:nicotinamidase-related amidase